MDLDRISRTNKTDQKLPYLAQDGTGDKIPRGSVAGVGSLHEEPSPPKREQALGKQHYEHLFEEKPQAGKRARSATLTGKTTTMKGISNFFQKIGNGKSKEDSHINYEGSSSLNNGIVCSLIACTNKL